MKIYHFPIKYPTDHSINVEANSLGEAQKQAKEVYRYDSAVSDIDFTVDYDNPVIKDKPDPNLRFLLVGSVDYEGSEVIGVYATLQDAKDNCQGQHYVDKYHISRIDLRTNEITPLCNADATVTGFDLLWRDVNDV